MVSKLIRLGVENILKIFCEKIKIRNILIINKKDNFRGIIDELYIKAESIIFNKINICNVDIKVRDIILKFPFYNKKFFIDNCYAVINIRLTRDNINKTLLNNKWKRLKYSIESFISMSFQSVEINNKSLCFVSTNGISSKKIDYNLQYDKNSISLVNSINHKKLSILNDKNIIVNNILFFESYIDIELSSQIIFS